MWPGRLRVSTDRAERVGGGGNGHQAVSPDLHAVAAAPLSHEADIGQVVIVAEEGLLAAVAPLGEVVRTAGGDDSGQSRHSDRLMLSRE